MNIGKDMLSAPILFGFAYRSFNPTQDSVGFSYKFTYGGEAFQRLSIATILLSTLLISMTSSVYPSQAHKPSATHSHKRKIPGSSIEKIEW